MMWLDMDHQASPAPTAWSLTDLARLGDVTPRTIRYYISQGLLAAPTGSGPAARYGPAHLGRLRAIRRLQREHLPLAEIRSRLGRLTDAQVDGLLADDDATDAAAHPTDSAADYIRRVMAGTPKAPAMAVRAALKAAEPAVMSEISAAPTTPPSPPSPTPEPEPDRSTWERVALTPDIEIHLRRPLDRQTNKRVDRLIRIARELLDED